MCGIVGLFNPAKIPLQSISELVSGDVRALSEGMLGLIQHRGPDEMGRLETEYGFIASARLSIVDLKTGIQPIANEDETIWIVYNGEIYDCDELRSRLIALGYRFRTQTDTEIILHLYQEYGDDCTQFLNGEFAFAIYDAKENRLVLARDRFGVRPLYFRRLPNDVLLFSSEIKPLLWAAGNEQTSYDSSAFSQTLESWAIIPPATIYREVSQLAPNSLVAIDAHGVHKTTTRDIWPRADESLTHDSAEIADVIERAVQRRLVADVPVGIYLSGGIDSAIVATLATKNSSEKLKSFSIEFEDENLDESEPQRELSAFLGTEHHSVRITTADIIENFVESVLSAETIVFRSAFVPMNLLSKLVHETGIKTVLTGEGADELFGGYDIFKEFLILTDWSSSGDDKQALMRLQELYPYLPQFQGGRARFALPFYREFLKDVNEPMFGHRVRWSNYKALSGLLSDDSDKTATGQALKETFPEFLHYTPETQCRVAEQLTLLHGYLLSTQGDRMASANSVETRLPFLDEDVLMLAKDYSLDDQLRGFKEKHLLRDAFVKDLPQSIVNRRKRPYLAPDAELFFEHEEEFGLSQYLNEDAIASHGMFDVEAVSAFLARIRNLHRTGRALSRRDNTAFFVILSAMIIHLHIKSRLRPNQISHLIKKSVRI